MSQPNQLYSNSERLTQKANSTFEGVSNGAGVLNTVILLSGALSAIFFWQQSPAVFANVHPTLAIVFGLLVGLLPSEGAFFAWRKLRETKEDMTSKQLAASTWGIIASIISSIFSTFAMFAISFTYVPEEISLYADWLVFVALSVPIIVQVVIIAYFAVNERKTQEAYTRAQLNAMGFNAWANLEKARMAAIIEQSKAEFDNSVEEYAKRVGKSQAGAFLQDGEQNLLSNNAPRQTVTAAQTSPAPAHLEPREDAANFTSGNGQE